VLHQQALIQHRPLIIFTGKGCLSLLIAPVSSQTPGGRGAGTRRQGSVTPRPATAGDLLVARSKGQPRTIVPGVRLTHGHRAIPDEGVSATKTERDMHGREPGTGRGRAGVVLLVFLSIVVCTIAAGIVLAVGSASLRVGRYLLLSLFFVFPAVLVAAVVVLFVEYITRRKRAFL